MAESDNESGGGQAQCPREQDRFLPIANVSRIMKKALPANAKISKDAKETVQECVSEFISFITGEASDKCQREKRKTINGDDLLWAMTTLGFEEYVEPLKAYLHKFREMEGDKAGVGMGVPPSSKDTPGGGGGTVVNITNNPDIYGGSGRMYGGGGGMMMGQQMYGSSPPSSYHHHQHQMGVNVNLMGGKGSNFASGGNGNGNGNGNGGSSTSSGGGGGGGDGGGGFARQNRI